MPLFLQKINSVHTVNKLKHMCFDSSLNYIYLQDSCQLIRDLKILYKIVIFDALYLKVYVQFKTLK